jgi:YVTN family beta-propeller protein
MLLGLKISLRTVVPVATFVLLGAADAGAVITGQFPQWIAANPVTGRVYVTNRAGGSVTVIDGASSTVLATIPVGNDPDRIAVNSASNRVYVLHSIYEANPSLAVIDGVSNTVQSNIPLAFRPEGLAVDFTTGLVYVGITLLNRVDIFDASGTLVSSATMGWPSQLAINPQAHRLYVTRRDENVLNVLDTTTNNSVASIPLGDFPGGIAVNRATNRIYVGNGFDSISVIDGVTNTIVATIDQDSLGSYLFNPASLAVNERTNKLYTPAGPTFARLLEIDGSTLQITRRFPVADRAYIFGVGVDPRLGRTYSVIDLGNVAVYLDKELLFNPSFEQNSRGTSPFPQGWRRQNLDAVLDLRSSDCYDGARSFRVTGASGVTKRIGQDISVSGPAGAVLHFEAFSKAAGASETGGPYAIVFNVYYDDGAQRTVHRQFSRGTHDWERQFGRVVAAKPFSRLSYRIDYADQAGEAWFDALHVWMDAPTP